jgi:carbonic anhydrase
VVNVCQTTIVQDAWARGQQLSVHGWIYGINDGLVRDLSMHVSAADELGACYGSAIESVVGGRGGR